MYTKMEGCPFKITPNMIFNNSDIVHICIGQFAKHFKRKWGCCPSWENEQTKYYTSNIDAIYCTVVSGSGKVCFESYGLHNNWNHTMSNMFEMCKAMADLTPQSHAQAMLLCLRRTAPKLYAVNDVVSQLNNYVKLGEFTEDDFRDIMMSDKGMLVIRLYLSWWKNDCVHYRSAKRKRRWNVFSRQRVKRCRGALRVPIDNAKDVDFKC